MSWLFVLMSWRQWLLVRPGTCMCGSVNACVAVYDVYVYDVVVRIHVWLC